MMAANLLLCGNSLRPGKFRLRAISTYCNEGAKLPFLRGRFAFFPASICKKKMLSEKRGTHR
jgi:hypothetical protein